MVFLSLGILSNPTRRLAAKAADKMEDVAWKVSDTLNEKFEDL